MDSLEQLACWAFDCTRAELYTLSYEKNENGTKNFYRALKDYNQGMPVQYITGETEFMGFRFFVNPSVLIPRFETEMLVEKALEILDKEGPLAPDILDIGTGSGAIAISLTKFNPLCKIVASDVSEDALETARKNAVLNGVDSRIKFLLSYLFECLDETIKFDMIISNPPYIAAEDYAALPAEVKHEPRIALDGGKMGLKFYEKIIPEAAEKLNPYGYLVLEMGLGQADAVKNMAEKTKRLDEPRIIKDYNGIERIFFARKRK